LVADLYQIFQGHFKISFLFNVSMMDPRVALLAKNDCIDRGVAYASRDVMKFRVVPAALEARIPDIKEKPSGLN